MTDLIHITRSYCLGCSLTTLSKLSAKYLMFLVFKPAMDILPFVVRYM